MPTTLRAAVGGGDGVTRLLASVAVLLTCVTRAAAECAPSSIPMSLALYGLNRTVCQQSSGTHSFTIDNPTGAGLFYYSTDGPDCAGKSQPPNYYPSPYSNIVGAFGKLITVTGAPCRSAPCCAIVYCVRGSEAPPHSMPRGVHILRPSTLSDPDPNPHSPINRRLMARAARTCFSTARGIRPRTHPLR